VRKRFRHARKAVEGETGRMGSANLAQRLLTTQDPGEGARLAYELERINKERADVQNQIWDSVKKRVEEQISLGRFRYGIVVGDESWHEGVVGIVASRVTETFRRPAVVIGIREGHAKGSVRSFAGKDVLAAIRASSEHLLAFGGHKHAAGVSLKPENLEAFALSFDRALSEMEEDRALKPITVDATVDLSELNLKALTEIEKLGPFGPGNAEPVLVIRAEIHSQSLIKGRHIRLRLGRQGSVQDAIEGIWFHGAERTEYLKKEVDHCAGYWAGMPELNRYRGSVTPTFRVKDWRSDWLEQ
jgi:single-stranded-DNA-specific exonuclease